MKQDVVVLPPVWVEARYQPRKERPFRNTQHRGGSRPRKPHNRWPEVMLVVADAVVSQVKGGPDVWVTDRRRQIDEAVFRTRMERLLPGVWWWLDRHHSPTKSRKSQLLLNRVYKMYYNGTSARGRDHDPTTRNAMSAEHWSHRHGPDSPLARVHEQVARGLVETVEGWERLLPT